MINIEWKNVRAGCGTKRKQGIGIASALLVLVSMAVTFTRPAWGADWMVTPTLTLREIYTDNINLSPDREDAEFVTEVTPAVSIQADGRRLDLSLAYNLQAILFPSGDYDNEINHQLNATSTGELVKELLFVDIDGDISQTNADNTRRLANDNISQTGNRIDTYAYRASPYVRNRFGSFAQSELRYAFGEVINEGDTVDSETQRINFQINSGSRFARLPWQLFGEERDVDFDDGVETEYRQAGAGLRYVLSRTFSVNGRAGYEVQDFGGVRGDDEGVFWQTGATWTPSPRTSFDGGYGKRYFGNSLFFSIQHNSRRSSLRASYDEDVSQPGNQILSRQLVPGTQVRIPTNQVTFTSEVEVTKRFEGEVTVSGRRTNIGLTGFHEDRDFQNTGDKETVFGAFTTLSRSLSPLTTFRIGGRWEETRFRDGVREDTRWEGTAGLTRSLGQNANGTIEYGYTDLESNQPVNEFQENRISISLFITF